MAAPIMSFSPNGENFAFCGLEGTLKIWETATNTLKQKYVSSSHLSASCTCLKWQPIEKTVSFVPSKNRAKRRKSEAAASVTAQSDLIALGTSTGDILIYSSLRGELEGHLNGAHAKKVNDISWASKSDNNSSHLFSCSDDMLIVEWNITSTKSRQIKKSWKGDERPIHTLSLCCGNTMLLSASCSIKLWDLSSNEVVRTFTGHATEVSMLLVIPSATGSNEGFYFVSAALQDRFINVWHHSNSKKGKGKMQKHPIVAALQLTESPAVIDIYGPVKDTGAYLFSVVTTSGIFFLFQQVLNGICVKPIQPSVKLQILSSNDEVPRPLTVLSTCFIFGDSILLSYGGPLKPTFEKISCGGLEKETFLLRQDSGMKIAKSIDVSKVKTPVTSEDVKILASGHMAPSKPTSAKMIMRKRLTSIDLSVEERLDVMGLGDKADKAELPILQTTSAAVLLGQGLKSQDNKILNHVLQNGNSVLIRNTLYKLPITLIIPFVEELSKRLQGHAQINQITLKWTKSLLTIHSAYLMTFPELVEKIRVIYQLALARVTHFERMSQLQGRLELMLSQVSNQAEVVEKTDKLEALVSLQDDSSDDELLLQGLEDKSDNEWNESSSDMEAETAPTTQDDPSIEMDEVEGADDDDDEESDSDAAQDAEESEEDSDTEDSNDD